MWTYEAKKKWCPMGRYGVSEYEGNATNVWGKSGDKTFFECLANACMMWRHDVLTNDGYCGLAGKP